MLTIVNARLALYAALAMPPIAILTFIFAHRLFPISQLVQARKGNLAEATDEAVVGIEMVQAFGREDDVRTRFLGRAEAVRHETMRRRRSRRTSSPASSSCRRSGSPPCSSSAAAT